MMAVMVNKCCVSYLQSNLFCTQLRTLHINEVLKFIQKYENIIVKIQK